VKTLKGKLETSGGARAAAAVTIDETALTLSAEGEHLGSWGFDAVAVRRTASDRFVLDLIDERLIFIANDPIDFAYTVPKWIETHQPKKKGGLRRRVSRGKESLIARIENSGGRRRAQKLAKSTEHVHAWRQQALPGGLIRRVCTECDHVSIDLRDAEQPEEQVALPPPPSITK